MVHDNVSLTVSQNEATKVEDEAKRRLLASKKLSLVVDLDQTIIHATVDPTVAEWQKDEKNPNHAAVKDVRKFQLVDDGPGARGCWYYIKLRPGLQDFLENVSKMFELHIYTMGTRAYAQNIATIIDPGRKIFGDRILSRDESGSLVAKNLQRLFPVDTKMVVIIDDRGDVWNWNQNFIKVTPYDFFVGIGDINSSFLPKKPGIKTSPRTETAAISNSNQSLGDGVSSNEPKITSNDDTPDQPTDTALISSISAPSGVSALEQLVSMGGGDDPLTLQAQTSRQDETLAAQLQDRPLLQKQLKLEAEDAANESSPHEDGEKSNNLSDGHKLLRDYDQELVHLEESLRKVHTEYFDTYARQLASAHGGRIAELRGSQKRKQPLNDNSDLALVPDIKTIMPQLKNRVLEEVVLVFSGVIPLHIDWHTSDIALWARNFGAIVEKDVGKKTTHVVAARNRTVKVRQAAKWGKGRIKVVSPAWLTDSICRWQKQDERSYLLNVEESDTASARGGLGDEDEILSESEELASGIDMEDDASKVQGMESIKEKPKMVLNLAIQDSVDDESDLEGLLPGDFEDEHSPVGGTNEDWSRMHDELEEFLGSEAEDSDNESTTSVESGARPRGKKRSLEESGDESEDGTPRAIGRKKKALGRVSSLSQIYLPGAVEDISGLPTPDITAGEEGEKQFEKLERDEESQAENGLAETFRGERKDENEDGWSDFEDDLQAEMEKAASEDHGEG